MDKKIFGLFALLLLGIVAVAGIADAYMGDPETVGPNYDAELHEQLEEAISSRDYNSWISLREEYGMPLQGKIFSVIDADNFGLFADMHDAMQEGDLDKAAEIRAKLGLGQGMMKRGNSDRTQAYAEGCDGSMQGRENIQGMKGQGRARNIQ